MFQLRILIDPEHMVNLRNFLEKLVVIPFGKAPCHNKFLTASFGFQSGHFEDGIDRLAFGSLDEPTGINDDDIRLFLVRRDLIPILQQVA